MAPSVNVMSLDGMGLFVRQWLLRDFSPPAVSDLMSRTPKGAQVKARVSADLKRKVQAMALAKGDAENESLVVREALVGYFRRPEVAALLAEGLRLLEEKEREVTKREATKREEEEGGESDMGSSLP